MLGANPLGRVALGQDTTGVAPSTILATLTISGIPDGLQLITLYNDTTDALVYNDNLTFTGGVATVELVGDETTIYTGTWLGDNPPTTGAGLYGVGATINGIANGFNGGTPITVPFLIINPITSNIVRSIIR